MAAGNPNRKGTTWSWRTATTFVWIAIAVPAWPMVADFWHNERYYPELMHDSGLLSVQLLVFTLLITPLASALAKREAFKPFSRWLVKRRRNLGVGSFAYACFHLLFYIRETADLTLIFLEATDPALLLGWIALLIFAPLAITSNNWSVQKLLTRWKKIHLWVYPAGFATFLHWVLLDDFLTTFTIWASVLVFGKICHLAIRQRQYVG